jgi:hypothetical protein
VRVHTLDDLCLRGLCAALPGSRKRRLASAGWLIVGPHQGSAKGAPPDSTIHPEAGPKLHMMPNAVFSRTMGAELAAAARSAQSSLRRFSLIWQRVSKLIPGTRVYW